MGANGKDSEAPSGRRSSVFFAPLAGTRGRLVLGLLSALWLISTTIAVIWWFNAVRAPTPEGLLFNSAVLAFDAVVLPLWVLFFARRMRRPLPDPRQPSFRIAMVVTKAPSERWQVVERTLRAMLSQDLPSPYDVWLADEDPDQETVSWCEDHGVGITTRRGIPEYHRDDWPRRGLCKEGNLAYFYDTVGYERYDIVAQLDADHVPATGYLRHIVAPFADPRIGYVAAPSICDRNAERSWSARGRLYSESILHGAIQAGCNGGWAPACIGSHYAVRTTALKEIGGLGPELAEDFSTTIMMAAGRWEGAFAIDAEAHGDGPETVADCVTQDFQWSRSMITLGLTLGPQKLPKATWRARLRLGSCLAWYPLYALVMFASFAIPVVALLAGEALVRVHLTAFYYHLILPLILLIAVAYWLRYLGGLRPKDAKVISWEAILFQLVRWPWAFLGCVQAVAGRITGRQFGFKVTPKGAAAERPLPLRVITPYLFISVVSGLCVVLVRDPEGAVGYYFLALVNTVIYLGVASAALILHLRQQSWTLPGRKALLVTSLTAAGFVAVAALVVNGSTAVETVTYPGPPPERIAKPSPFPPESDPRGKVAIGVTTNAGARNVAVPWEAAQLNQVNDFERAIRAHADIIMWFSDWASGEVDRRQLDAVAARGSVPEITWEPWDGTLDRFKPQPEYSMQSIASGDHDEYVRRWADELRAFGGPVLLRFAQEMNVPGTGYPWAQPDQNSPAEYVAAWRHIHDIFESRGASNVRWVWSPLASFLTTDYYPGSRHVNPGSRYVDVIGLSGFNGGSALPWNGWRSFKRIFGEELRQARRIAPGKPVQIAEVATAVGAGSKAEWIASMFRTIEAHPEVRSVLWFNAPKETNWRIQSSRGAMKAFSEAMKKPRYGNVPYSAADTGGR